MARLIFVDFDDTLCVHTEYLTDKYKQFICGNKETACENIYKNSLPNTLLINYLIKEKSKGNVRIILLSSAMSFLLELKKLWCLHHCPDLFDDFIGVSIELSKADIIESYCKYYGLNNEDALFIEDSWKERLPAYQKGIPNQTPQEVMLRSL